MYCYNCGKKLPDGAFGCPDCLQELFTFVSSKRPAKGRRLDGCLTGGESASDFKAVPNLTSLPSRVDLRPECSAVEDQGHLGSCVANAVVGALEHQQRRQGKPPVDLSRMFVYYHARKMSGDEQIDCGTTIAKGMAALLAFGAPPEAAWPYDPANFARRPPDSLEEQARSNTPAEYARVEGLEHIKGSLARRCPVVFAASLPERCYEEAGRTGVMPQPTEAELAPIRTMNGRHALLLVGYDTGDGVFFVRNSWGESWGDRGYCRMTIDTFEASMAASTAWILGKLEASGDFTVERPSLSVKPVEGGVRDLGGKIRDEIRSGLTTDMDAALKDIRRRVNPPRQGQ